MINNVDVDGDKSLVVSDTSIIDLAKKNMNNIVPLYYNMKKALPSKLNSETLYKGLNSAFAGSNIGQYSNNITKIWNSDTFVNGTEEEKQDAIDLVKILCMENNFCIDYAKTLYMPTRPKDIDTKIKSYTKNRVPHFFKYAKDRENSQVSDKNNSFINMLENIIPSPRISYKDVNIGEIDYKLLMNNPEITFNIEFNEKGQLIDDKTDPLIIKYNELNKKYHYKINMKDADIDTVKCNTSSSLRQSVVFRKIADEIRYELSKFGYSDIEICDILVKYLYHIKNSKHKESLWFCYGEYIVDNLKRNVKKPTKTIQCKDCGEWFEINRTNNITYRCSECQNKARLKFKNGYKTIQCIDCKKTISVSCKSTKTCRCDECQKIRKYELRKIRKNNKNKRCS